MEKGGSMDNKAFNFKRFREETARLDRLKKYQELFDDWVTPKYEFTRDVIENEVPENIAGVYVLFINSTLARFGQSENKGEQTSDVKTRLLDHIGKLEKYVAEGDSALRGLSQSDQVVVRCTGFNFIGINNSDSAYQSEQELIDRHRKEFGDRPVGNPSPERETSDDS